MRILVRTEGAGWARMARAAAGLELRGHEVLWRGRGAPPGSKGGAFDRPTADLVLGGAAPAGAAWQGWRTGAQSMLLSLSGDVTARWRILDRWCWESLDSWAMVEAVLPGIPVIPHVDPQRTFTWPTEPSADAADPADPATEALERAAERILGRRRGGAPRPAAFLDRDGTMVVERGYASAGSQMELLPGVPEAIRQIQAAGYAVVVISNQAGVGRGLFPLAAVYDSMAALRSLLRPHGVELDAIYFCPHHPDVGCRCRKPAPGLLHDAARNLNLSLEDSVMIGDKRLDAAAGQAVGALGILVRSGYGGAEEDPAPATSSRAPDRIFEDLRAAAAFVAARGAED